MADWMKWSAAAAFAAFMIGLGLLLDAQPPAPGAAFISTGSPVIEVGGIPVAAEPNINFASSQGILQIATDNPSLQRVDITPATNSTYVPTFDQLHANPNFCDATGSTVGAGPVALAYACSLLPSPLVGYARGSAFLLAVDTTCATTCTINIGTLGPITLYQADGVTPPGGLLIAGQAQWIWFDGTIFRLFRLV